MMIASFRLSKQIILVASVKRRRALVATNPIKE
jgi:hypothetical protein